MKIELNGTVVELTETNGIVKVDVSTENANVVVNNSLLWATFDKEEYVYIPEYMRQFIKDANPEMGKESEYVYADCYNSEIKPCASFYFKLQQNKPVHVRFDYVESIEGFKEYLEDNSLEVKQVKEVYKQISNLNEKLQNALKKYNFKWEYSHSQNEHMYAWWDIVITEGNWNEQGFMECWAIIGEVNVALSKAIDKYNLY